MGVGVRQKRAEYEQNKLYIYIKYLNYGFV